jgi:arginine utilization protein RocB
VWDLYLQCFEDVKEITECLVKIPSIVNTDGEKNCAKEIYKYYSNLTYFKENPDYLLLQEIKDDEMERYNVISMVKGTKGNSNKTIILMGHLDTVGVEDFGSFRDYAFDPDKLPEILKSLNLGHEVDTDILSGEYLFGRGALDMKSGIAGHMYLMKYFSEHLDELDGNIISISEADEEGNSNGIISALEVLKEWKEKYNLEYIAAINADYSTPYDGKDENQYVYFGNVGKLLPSFHVVGKGTQVGQAYEGLDPNLIVAELTRNIELNTDFCDEMMGEVTLPPISLKQSDFKEGYTAQTAIAAQSYYNFFTFTMSPGDVIKKMKEKAIESFDNALDYVNKSYEKYCKLSNMDFTKLNWETRVYTWEEFYNELATIHGEKFKIYMHNFAKELNELFPSLDLREFSTIVINEAWTKWSDDKSPAIIIYYSSQFYGRITVTGKNELERQLLDSVREAVEFVQDYSDKPIKTKMFYPYVSDANFIASSDDIGEIKTLKKNMPAWGTKYTYPIDDILEINVPVVNIGTFGKDGHKLTERVHMKYTFENVPNITYTTIRKLLK